MSRTRIARDLGLGVSTVARWFREDGVTRPEGASRMDAWRISNRRTLEERWAHQQAEQDRHRDAVGPLTERELFLVGVALYWAEGTKAKPWRRRHRVVLVNSDETIIRTFLAWLDLVHVRRGRLRCSVLIHDSADVAAAERFWRELVGPEAVLTKTTLKRHQPRSVRHNVGEAYRGCLTLRIVDSARLYRLVAGTWQGMHGAAAAVLSSPADTQSPVV